jgi:hypothetical protein
MAAILAARKLAQYDGGKRVPATVSVIADAIRWAEEIMAEIDRRWPANKWIGWSAGGGRRFPILRSCPPLRMYYRLQVLERCL